MDNQSANATPVPSITGIAEITKIQQQIVQAQLPAQLKEKALLQIDRINLSLKFGGNLAQLDITEKYVDWITSMPWFTMTTDTLDIKKAKTVLDKNHFGLEKIKQRVLEYLSILILQRQQQSEGFHAPSLFFVGLAGTGKTTFAKSVADALGRQFARIPFGGLASPQDLRGQPKISPEAEPGMIMRALRQVKSRNPVILLDELDRCTPESRAAIMGVLIEVLDPGQNRNYTDYFIDFPFDLSQVIFIATANNTKDVATAVLDRLELIQMPSYTDEEKIQIGKQYVLPRYIHDAGLTPQQLQVDDAIWSKLVRPLGFEPGIRSLERMIDAMVRKVAYKIVSGQGTAFVINDANMREFFPL